MQRLSDIGWLDDKKCQNCGRRHGETQFFFRKDEKEQSVTRNPDARRHGQPGLTEPGPNRPNKQQARSHNCRRPEATPANSLRKPAGWYTPAWLSIAGRTTTEWNGGEFSALTGTCTKTVIGGTRLLRDSNARPPQTPSRRWHLSPSTNSWYLRRLVFSASWMAWPSQRPLATP